MKRNLTHTLLAALLISALATLVGLTWANYSYSYQNAGGEEFLPGYAATRLFLLEGESPYGARVDQEIERQAAARQGNGITGENGVSYFTEPFYAVLLFTPFALIPNYHLAHAIWMTVLEISVIGLVLLSISLSRWKISIWSLIAIIIFSVFWYHSFIPIISGNLTILVALMIVLALMAIRARNDGLAGILLAFSSIKPEMMLVLAVYVMIYSIVQQRWRIFWGFISSLAFLIGTSFLFIPDWTLQYLRKVIREPDQVFGITPRRVLVESLPGVGEQVGWALTILMLTALIVEWRASTHEDFPWFYWTALLSLVATNLIGIATNPANFVALIPAVVLVFSAWDSHWRMVGKWLVILSMILLFFGPWAFFLQNLEAPSQLIHYPITFVGLPIFLLITLYWTRWWIVHPTRPLFEQWKG